MVSALKSYVRSHPARSVLAGALVVLGIVVLVNLLLSGSDPRVDAIRKQGLPTTLAEWDAYYPTLPHTNNPALVFARALNGAWGEPFPERLPERGSSWKPEVEALFTSAVKANRELYEQFYATAGLAPGRYPIDLRQGLWTALPHLSRIKHCTMLLGGEAIMQAGRGDPDQAARALRAAGQLPESLAAEPLLISQLVRFSGWAIWSSRLERVVNLAELSDSDLAQFQEMARQAERPDSLFRALVGERAAGLSVFDDPAQRSGMLAGGGAGQGRNAFAGFGSTVVTTGLKAGGFFRADRAFYLDSMGERIRTAGLSFPERWRQAAQSRAEAGLVTNRFYFFSRMLLPALSRAAAHDADHAARMRVARTALAVERFRMANGGRAPDSLDAVVPQFLPEVPADPYDGAPLRYRSLNPGFVVYSVGRDTADDGGNEPARKAAGRGEDVTFIVER